ncbi:MAG: hypothetical protein ACPL4E_04735 [Thermoproteota archaeon]
MNSLLSIQGFFKSTMLIIIIMLSAIPFTNTSAMSVELAYDDCGAEGFWSDYYPNGVAVKFSPPASRWRITAILVYGFIIDRGEKPFMVELRDEDLNVILRASLPISEYFKNATLHWARVPLPNVIVKSDFYVCVYPLLESNGTQLWIAIDNDTISNRSFLVDCYGLSMRKYEGGNVMIRVEGEEAIEFVEITPDSIFVEEEALRLFFKVTTGNIMELKAILQTGSLPEDCKVMRRDERYEVIINWQRLSGLKEPAKLTLSAKAQNSTASLTIKLGETLLSTCFQLRDENALLRAMLNSSKPEQETLKHRLENEESNIIALRFLLNTYEKKLLDEAERNERICRELNTLRLLTALLAVSIIFLLIIILRIRSLAGLTSAGIGKRGEQRRSGKH